MSVLDKEDKVVSRSISKPALKMDRSLSAVGTQDSLNAPEMTLT